MSEQNKERTEGSAVETHLGYVIARGESAPLTYSDTDGAWYRNPDKATVFATIAAAEESIGRLDRFKKSARVMNIRSRGQYMLLSAVKAE